MFLFSSPTYSWSYLTLLFVGVFLCVCVDVGYVHPNYVEAGCVLIMFCIILMLHFKLIKSTQIGRAHV